MSNKIEEWCVNLVKASRSNYLGGLPVHFDEEHWNKERPSDQANWKIRDDTKLLFLQVIRAVIKLKNTSGLSGSSSDI